MNPTVCRSKRMLPWRKHKSSLTPGPNSMRRSPCRGLEEMWMRSRSAGARAVAPKISFWPQRRHNCAVEACGSIPRRRNRSRSRLRSLAHGRCAGALLGTYMRDIGGKSGRRPGSHLQVQASGPHNARPAHWRLVGRSRRGEVAEGCTGGVAGRSKGLICLRVT